MDLLFRNLKNCVLFQHLSRNELKALFNDVTYQIKSYNKNEVIFSPNHKADTLGIILEGGIEVQKIFSSGKVITVNRRYPYDIIADASLFANIEYYPSTLTAFKPCDLFLIQKKELMKLFNKDDIIMSKFLESVSNRVFSLNQTIEILSINSVPGKIAYYLLLEYKKQNNPIVHLNFTKKSFAEHLNVSRPTLSRELKNLQDKDILTVEKRMITIHNIKALEMICCQ
ncbi:CRP-like cAMP-binding protein [Natranaerovirga hydrolytica]|uniref:CRP-like cAMP-binding protein n=1 Tax=Natranaerovirga hydrolytica TaxID=680378 RepID=A0A4R1MN65_9FIRM|nr:Crp/Fnr family transcriptional regulator [Natranaerovirga hydrolytica]TCK92734.1 CRP-like cAMP-binding protein [Natranaerovirga hydrolytica]